MRRKYRGEPDGDLPVAPITTANRGVRKYIINLCGGKGGQWEVKKRKEMTMRTLEISKGFTLA
jgi:hypothetical protein